ncbi:uncharacterized protein A1O9_03615 [Exophiala aquamarina CBS 119918]|uniref:RING-type domain-containing protein n=1 Tax=Exophiala aquamarina CBS 119918 TaxID=1182545 RepID=A0A072PGB9_9EURO|nr:uncharacterized protein A1O9_03615 [Exophiala aquamarina CBS 119918]KEF58772.1 hypothetical protein A1O9_03615 [Exophiala aquamarina CBS 119918]
MASSHVNTKWLVSVALWMSLPPWTLAQTIAPSNGTQDLYPAATSPRFILNGTQLGDIPVIRLAPLGHYAEISHGAFEQIRVEGQIVNVGASNANQVAEVNQFSYLSCDPEAYTGNLGPSDVFRIVVNSPRTNIIILYSVTSDHCVATDIDNLPTIGGILTTTDTMLASSLAALNLNQNSPGSATILPDLNSYTNTSRNGGWNGGGALGQSPTTAVAMIILYSITGIITALFVVIIVTGAIRAHRHPERYGPRNILGRGRQSRAKGIARAMLETLPIVKFGDHQDLPKKSVDGQDIEMTAGEPAKAADSNGDVPATGAGAAGADPAESIKEGSESAPPTVTPANNPDGTDAEGHLGCSICTEDFQKGEELRVLPCNHKFHPDCVDPWLLNVSGTCPLCRIDLRPSTANGEDPTSMSRRGSSAAGAEQEGQLSPPPLTEGVAVAVAGQPSHGGRRETVANFSLRHLASGTREERIAALRRLRQERLGSASNNASEAERHGLTSRFRERFRIRTERRDAGAGDSPPRRRSGANVPSTFFG